MIETTAAEKTPTKPSLFAVILLFFIFLFFRPITWLADKIHGSGSGAGPAFASFMMASVIVLGGAMVLGLGIIVGFYFLT